ncbi:pentapeptide repeat-containing protein [Brasilonema octagenarum]|uniref:Low-complexity protein n=1 Tax=Brasilonema octagenarum UFV-OR1 TaxID=417115 RepID=A0ABX1MFT2_9CYAN|nr:pentapeptide repeat-containing protein [Brasilonema octagenarum]NMF64737.1 low-complexity protein [Brasilonema octagenarum UFV-OR1]
MATPSVKTSDQSSRSKEPTKTNSLPLATRRIAAWAVEITLVVASGLVPFGIGAYANSRSDLDRVPLNPLLVQTERAIASPLALPISYGTRNVASPTNLLWTIALLAPLTVSGAQLYLLAKTGATPAKHRFGIKVVNAEGKPPGFKAVLVREGLGRWGLPMSVAYFLWRNSFLFPSLGGFASLAVIMLVLEAKGLPWQQDRRALHNTLAGTYTVDDSTPLTVQSQGDGQGSQSFESEKDEEDAIASIVITQELPRQQSKQRQGIPQNPNYTVVGVAFFCMSAALAILVGTQIYVKILRNQQVTEQSNNQQFLALIKDLNPNSTATNNQRQKAILAMGTLNDAQSTQYLVDLLSKETDPILLQTIQQALVNVGPNAIPNLKRMNQFLTGELEPVKGSKALPPEVLEKQLQANQYAISKILAVYNGQTNGLDLSNVSLSQNGSEQSYFNLVLDKKDLWGIKFKSANLSFGSFKGSRFRGVGEDGRWDTYDDWIADLSQARMRQANLTEANLSRVLMVRTDLSRAILNKANLSNARLTAANLSSAQLEGADLEGAVLENVSLTGADLSDAQLKDADLYAARLGRVIAVGTQFSFANLTKTDWQGADLTGAYFDHANLKDANLNATRLTKAILRSANMENANLRNADLSFADLQGANLAGADFQGAILTSSKQNQTEQFVQTPALGVQSAVVEGVDFSKVKNLDPKQIAYICTQGGIHPRCP